LVIDGYSGGDLQDGYLTGLVLEDRANGGTTTLEIHADDGEINQVGTGDVTFNGNVTANQNVTVEGDLTVKGTTTSIETDQMVVTDPITVVNASGTEFLSDWSAFSVRDVDGYNRFGWVFDDSLTAFDDGYWAISVNGEANASNPDAVPTRAVAYLGAGDSYGDLSSTAAGDSGAGKIGISVINGLVATDVQAALEEISPYDVNGDYHIGAPGECVFFDGDLCSDIVPCCDDAYGLGDATHSFLDGYITTLESTTVNSTTVNATTVDATTVDATTVNSTTVNATDVNTTDVSATGDVTIGDELTVTGLTTFDGCVVFNGGVCSDIIPSTDDAYDIGSPTNRWNDGYFNNLDALNITFQATSVTELEVTGCLTVGNICSDLIPLIDDAYGLGDATHSFIDGYITTLESTTVNATTVNATTVDATTVDATTVNATDVNSTDVTATGDVTVGNDLTVTGLTTFDGCVVFNGGVCSDIVPCCDDAYGLGDATHSFIDGYITTLESTTVNATTVNATTVDATTVDATTVNATTVNATDVDATGDVTVGDELTVTGLATFDGCVVFNGNICSDIIPSIDDAYQIGDPTNRWIDGYFAMPTFTNITPVGNDNSLIGVLEGIDNALADANVDFPRGVYLTTLAEAIADEIDTSRTPDQGDVVDVGAGDITDAIFRDNIYVYRNGQLLFNDPTPAANAAAVVNDVARQTGSLSDLVFSGNLRRNSVIQIVDMR
jgi:cytoskeletal protein CcmA (bactofilin family)